MACSVFDDTEVHVAVEHGLQSQLGIERRADILIDRVGDSGAEANDEGASGQPCE